MSTRVYRFREMIDRTGQYNACSFIVEASGRLPVLGFKYMYPFLHKKRQLLCLEFGRNVINAHVLRKDGKLQP